MARKELPGGTAAKAVAPPAGVIWFSGRIGGPPSCISVKFGVVHPKWFFNKHSKTKVSPFFVGCQLLFGRVLYVGFRQWLFLAVFVAFCVDPGGDPLDDFTRPQRLLRVVENERRVLQMNYLQVFDVFCSAKCLKMLHSQNWPFYGL